jgi:ParB/RepB/Spo0J family partition protein
MPHYDSRATIYLCDPRTLTVDWTKNLSRDGTEPPVDDSLISLAKSMMPKDSDADGSSGQIHPILCRTASADATPTVIGGYRRLRAALWLVESGTCPDFKVKYTTSRLSDLEAALANMDENMQREDPAPMQLARAVRRLTEDFGMKLDAVAARLKRSTGYLNQLLNLVMLPQPIQASIANGETTVTAGIELARLSEADQTAVFSEVKAESANGTVKASEVRKKARKKAEKQATATTSPSMGGNVTLEDGRTVKRPKGNPGTATATAPKPAKPARAIKRSLKEIETFFDDRASLTEPSRGREFAGIILDFIDGKITEGVMERKWQEWIC